MSLRICCFVALFTASYACSQDLDGSPYLRPDYWQAEGIKRIAPFWFAHVIDSEAGGYHLRLSRDWQATPGDKMPAMISRQVYGFSVAYLLSGDPRYLEAAEIGVEFLLAHAWDEEYGGWYDRLTRGGLPVEATKSAPLQLYTNVGLSMYGYVTGDPRALDRVADSLAIRQKAGRDSLRGGYVQQLDRFLKFVDWGKNKHAHYGYVGSLLLNHFLATGDPSVINYSKELTDLSLERMRSPNGWLLGFRNQFNREWQLRPNLIEGQLAVSVGAQLTAALSFLRLSEQTGKAKYRDAGIELGRKVTEHGLDHERGAWLDLIDEAPPHAPIGKQKIHWWHQIYGAFLQLHLHRQTGEERFLSNFVRTEKFFDRFFRDQEFGGIFSDVDLQGGSEGKRIKAGPWRTSYHEMEHALLNYLYLSLLVSREPATLHFRFDRPGIQSVRPVDSPDVIIASVTRNGRPWSQFDRAACTVTTTDEKDQRFVVTYRPAKYPNEP